MADEGVQVLSPGRDSKSVDNASSPGIANRPRPAAINGHNRDVTEHTASLMSLFARPASPPKTPITPSGFGSSTYNSINLNLSDGVPLMPCSSPSAPQDELDFQRMPLIVRTTYNQAGNGQVYSSGSGSFISTNYSLSDTIRINSVDGHSRDETMLVQNLTDKEKDTIADVFACTPTRGNKASVGGNTASLLDLVSDPNLGKDYSTFSPRNENSRLPFLKSITESADKEDSSPSFHLHSKSNSNYTQEETRPSYYRKMKDYISNNACDSKQIKTTFIGALLYSLYSLVFCFAEASAITRPSHTHAEESGLLAPMAMMGAVATLVAGPIIIGVLGGFFPAPYPALDMFLAPFLAKMAADIDEVLVQTQDDSQPHHSDMEVFLATFVALNAFGMALSASLCILASKVKLANLASFLPYPVLCGFFSSVGISVWISAFKVDTGVTVQTVLASGEAGRIFREFGRHLPSLLAGVALYNYGPKKIGYLIGIISLTVILAYTALAVTNHTLEEAQGMGFFWKSSEVVMADESDDRQLVWGKFGPPSPLGLFFPSVLKSISRPAFMNGLNNVVAMSIIYLLRCSLHAAALRKNDMNIKEIIAKEQALHRGSETSESSNVFKSGQDSPKRSQMSVLCVLNWYAFSLIALVFSGGFAVLPALSLGGIFARINAHQRLPQFTAMLILLAFYLSDFRLVSYVPKFTFSSLLVMAAIDLVNTWFVKSYKKTMLYEWLVIPFIVAASLLSGMLQALGMGVCISTFIFVAQFYRSGVVKFVATGLTIRSSIERSCEDSKWLDNNGDLIHILVVQNYLYFGNATSCRNYVATMFTDDENAPGSDFDLPPVPKYVLLDMSIVTGIDTSAVDVMGEISALCKANSCCLLLSGIPPQLKPALIAGGLVPSRQNPHLFFMDDLDTALGKAEDDLLKVVAQNEEKLIQDGKKQRHQRITSMIDNGLRYALRKIDEQHDLEFSNHLAELEKYAVPRELEVGELLNEHGSEYLQRGLYFIESGLIKCSIDATASLTRGRQRAGQIMELRRNDMSIGQMHARSGMLARKAAMIKNSPRNNMLQVENTFRLGRFGPGWVIGTISEFTGQDIPGAYQCVTPCRVHVLTFEVIEELEIEKPALILNLYKMLAHLMSRRQEMTIGQLSTFRSIMSSAPTKPPSRRSLIAVNKTMQGSV